MISKWSIYDKIIEDTVLDGDSRSWNTIARDIFKSQNKKFIRKDVDLFRTYIKRKVLRNRNTIIDDTLDKINLEEKDWSIGWIKEKGISLLVKNPKGGVGISLEQMREDFVKEMIEYSPNYDAPILDKVEEAHLLTIDIADLHIGKLSTISEHGETYNVSVAVDRALTAVMSLVDKASGYNIEQVLFVIGNDVLHTDNINRQTTNGTNQDTDGTWYDNFKMARNLYVSILEYLSRKFKVHVVHNPSNHDFVSGYMLADSVYSWLHKNKNITWDISTRHRKYYKYGVNLIGTSHGDGAALDKLPLLMAEEAKEMWGTTIFRCIFLHHLHHMKKYKFQTGADFPGVTVEYLRSPSGSDSWHHKNGYQHAPKAIEAFINSYKNGPVAKLIHMFR
jgi:hypothetical protein